VSTLTKGRKNVGKIKNVHLLLNDVANVLQNEKINILKILETQAHVGEYFIETNIFET
jgi:hypothetical protein